MKIIFKNTGDSDVVELKGTILTIEGVGNFDLNSFEEIKIKEGDKFPEIEEGCFHCQGVDYLIIKVGGPGAHGRNTFFLTHSGNYSRFFGVDLRSDLDILSLRNFIDIFNMPEKERMELLQKKKMSFWELNKDKSDLEIKELWKNNRL